MAALKAAAVFAAGGAAGVIITRSLERGKDSGEDVKQGFCGAVGNTPLIELKSLSELTGCRILAKAEHLNPSGSVKDRAACCIIQEFHSRGLLKPGGVIIEATGGNTGVALALGAKSAGYKTIFTMPDCIAPEKIELMRLFGADVRLQPAVPFSDKRNYYHEAERLGKDMAPGAIFTNQFETLANFRAHYEGTGPEIWRQTGGKVDGFCVAAGTGGTIAGCSAYLKEKNPACQVYLIDPPGSALLSYVQRGVVQASGGGGSIQEGIGIGRITKNFAQAKIDGAFAGSDREAVDMAYYLLEEEGIFVGPSAALNVVGAVKLAKVLGPGHTVVTVLCDGGDRYRSKLYSAKWLAEKKLTPPPPRRSAAGSPSRRLLAISSP